MEYTRRTFLKKASAAGLGAASLTLAGNAANVNTETNSKKKATGKNDGKLKIGFIGTGSRCQEHIRNVLGIGGSTIVAICDTQQPSIDRAQKLIGQYNESSPKVYTGSEYAFEQMLNNEEFDCVIIATPGNGT